MSCPAPTSRRRTSRRAPRDSALPDSFTLRVRRVRGRWVVQGRSVSASGPDALSAVRDALAGLAAKGGRR